MNRRCRSIKIVAVLVFSAALSGGLAMAAPIAFPGTGTGYVYAEDFNEALGEEWSVDGWLTTDLFAGGATQVTKNGSGTGYVSPSSPSSLTYSDANFPLSAIKPAESFADYGFSGQWLINKGRAEDNGTATAKLEFNNLPEHTSIDIDLLLAVGDSIDGGTESSHADGPKTITVKVDGQTIFDFFFSAGGTNLSGDGVVKLISGGNLNSYYREQWNDNSGAGPSDENDRSMTSWTGDTAYDMSGYTGFTEIAHTSDQLTIEFIHNMSSSYTDEYQALDNLSVTLNGVAVPEPSTVVLLAVGVLLGSLAAVRRKR